MSSKPHLKADDQPEGQIIEGVYTIEFTPRQLNIIWGNDSRYWELPKEGTKDPAKLLQVSWLEVTGFTKPLKETGTYAISFELRTKPEAFGLSGCPLHVMAKVGKKGKYIAKKLTVPNATEPRKELPTGIGNDKLEINVTSPDQEIYFGLYEVWTGKWKGGLEIYNAKVRKTS